MICNTYKERISSGTELDNKEEKEDTIWNY